MRNAVIHLSTQTLFILQTLTQIHLPMTNPRWPSLSLCSTFLSWCDLGLLLCWLVSLASSTHSSAHRALTSGLRQLLRLSQVEGLILSSWFLPISVPASITALRIDHCIDVDGICIITSIPVLDWGCLWGTHAYLPLQCLTTCQQQQQVISVNSSL